MLNSLRNNGDKRSESDNGAFSALCKVSGLRLPARFFKLIDRKENGCWQWLGTKRCCGKHKGKRYYYPTYNAKYAHRLMYQAARGTIAASLEIDHLCHNKLCVNPDHLQAVTHQENCKRRPKSGPYRTPGSQRDRREKAAR